MADDLLIIPDEGSYRLMKPLIGFKSEMEQQLQRFPYRENVFLMLKFREANRDLSDFIIETLDRFDLRGVRADAPDWSVTSNVFNPIAVLYCCKYGVALFDEPEEHQAYSANVAYELGIMHYQRKKCLMLKHESLPAVPFDLIKDLYVPYSRDLDVRTAVTDWVTSIAEEPSHEPERVPDVAPPPTTDHALIETDSESLSGRGFAYTVLRRSRRYWKFSWKVEVGNIGDDRTRVRVRVEYLDESGFPLDHDTSYPDRPIDVGEVRDVGGTHNVGIDLAQRVQTARVFISQW